MWLELGIALEQANELAAALDAFLTANNADPELLDKDAQVSIGNLYLQLENLSQAESWLKKAEKIKGAPKQGLHSSLLRLAIIKKDWPAAEKQIEALDKSFPSYLDGSDLSQARQAIAEWRTKKEAAERALAEQKASIEAKQAEENSPTENSTTEMENTVTESKASLSEEVAPQRLWPSHQRSSITKHLPRKHRILQRAKWLIPPQITTIQKQLRRQAQVQQNVSPTLWHRLNKPRSTTITNGQ